MAIQASENLLNETLEGWKLAPHGAGNFEMLPEGTLRAGEPGVCSTLGILYYSVAAFRDFVLQLEWRAFDARANSGVFVRMPEPAGELDKDFYHRTTEIQIDDRGMHKVNGDIVAGSALHMTGAVYDVLPAVSEPGNGPNQWSRLEVTVKGMFISVAINDQLVSDGTLPDFKQREGYIGLQCHSDLVEFRNIRVKTL